jgi:hypothetical protein
MRSHHTARRITDAAAAMRRSHALLQRDHWSQDQLRAYQRQRLAELVRYATAHSAFYRELYRDIDTNDEIHLEGLPALDKATVMEHFDEVVTERSLRLADLERHLGELRNDELYLGRYRVTSTGGAPDREESSSPARTSGASTSRVWSASTSTWDCVHGCPGAGGSRRSPPHGPCT